MNKVLICIFLLLGCNYSYAKLKDFAAVEAVNDIILPLWAVGDGDQVQNRIFCVASSNYNNTYSDPPPLKSPPAVHENYDFTMIDRAAAAGYHLYLDSDESNTGNARIPVLFEHRDIKVPTTYESLSDAVYDAHSHTGQFKNCNNGDNSQIRMTLLNSVLSESRAGFYRGRFRARARGGSSGTKVRNKNFVVEIDVAEIVRINHLNTVPLGTWGMGEANLNYTESFCVYSNNATGGYNVTFSSANQDLSGNFRLANDDESEHIQYDVSFSDSLGGIGASVGISPISGLGDNTSANCSGGDNAEIKIEILSSDLGPAKSDDYSDSLMILVAPE